MDGYDKGENYLKHPKSAIIAMFLMTFALGLVTPIVNDIGNYVFTGKKIQGEINMIFVTILLVLISSLVILIPLYCYNFLSKNKITVEPITKEKSL